MVDLRLLPLDRFCNFVWWFMIRNAHEQTEIEKLRIRLWRPPPGQVATRGPWTPAAETAAFAALKAGLTH